MRILLTLMTVLIGRLFSKHNKVGLNPLSKMTPYVQ